MIRTLISSSTFPLPSQAGLPRFVYDLAEALTASCEVTALVPGAPGAPSCEQMGSVAVHRFTYFLPRSAQRLAYGHGMRDNMASVLGKIQVPPFFLAQASATRRLVKRRGVQVVNSHWLIPQGLSSALVKATRRDLRHVLSVHAADVYLLNKLPFGKAIARFVINHSDFVFADGSDVRDHLDRLLDRPSGAVLQPMGVHVEEFAQAEPFRTDEQPFEDGFLLFFGRFAEKKGVEYLLRAMPRVLDHHPGLGLVLVGYGALGAALRDEVGRLGIGASVRFEGRRTHAAIARFLRGCRVAVVPSVVDRNGETDGMPTVVLEAMATGARVVGSAVDGIPDVIRHGDNGWLCRQKDPEDLAEKLLLALSDSASSGIQRASRTTAREMDWQRVAERYSDVFRRLVASDGSGSS